jgi:hypothetical protein
MNDTEHTTQNTRTAGAVARDLYNARVYHYRGLREVKYTERVRRNGGIAVESGTRSEWRNDPPERGRIPYRYLHPGERRADATRATDPATLFVLHERLSTHMDGSLEDRANVHAFLERFGERNGVHESTGAYATRAAVVRADVTDPEILGVLERLDATAYGGRKVLDEGRVEELEERFRTEWMERALPRFWDRVERFCVERATAYANRFRANAATADVERFDATADADGLDAAIYQELDRFPERERRELLERLRERGSVPWTYDADGASFSVPKVVRALEIRDVTP